MSCHAQKKPQLPSLAQEGFLFLWAVLSCLSGPGGPFLSCHVLFCVSSPGGLLIPPNFHREFFFGGVEGFRLEWPWNTTCHGLQSSQLRRGLRLFRSGGPHPCLSWGASRAPTPLPGGTVTAWDTPSGGGRYVRVLLCVSSVPDSCVHIWLVSCPRQMWLLVNSCPAVLFSLSINNLCIYNPVCSLDFVGLLVTPGVSCL